MENLKVYDSLGNTLRIEKTLKYYDTFILEPIFLLNIACKIKETYISKDLGIVIRNLNENEINFCYPRIQKEIKKAMKLGYDLINKIERKYDVAVGELENSIRIIKDCKEIDFEHIHLFLQYFYPKSIFENVMGEKIIFSSIEDFENQEEISLKLAKNFCSNLIVLEVKNYEHLYKYINSYFGLNNSNNNIYYVNKHTLDFIKGFINLCNVVFFSNIGQDFKKFKFEIKEFSEAEFTVLGLVEFFDNYFNSIYHNKKISKNLKNVKSLFFDLYTNGSKEKINNLIFMSNSFDYDEKFFDDLNFKELNLNLISIIELLLISSKGTNKVEKKVKITDNILICLIVNKKLKDNYDLEKKVIATIYRYRSCLSHGNTSGYKNSLIDLLNLKKIDNYSDIFSEYTNVEIYISKLLVGYIHNIFLMNMNNPLLLEHIRN